MPSSFQSFHQIRVLTKKNLKLFWRNPSSVFTMIFVPILIVLSLILFAWLISKTKRECRDLEPSIIANSSISKCEYPSDCKSLVYFVIKNNPERILEENPIYDLINNIKDNNFSKFSDAPKIEKTEVRKIENSFKPKKNRIREIMEIVAFNNHLKFKEDIEEVIVHSSKQISDYFEQHQNKTQISYIFCDSDWDISFNNVDLKIPCHLDNLTDQDFIFYSVHYNVTHGVENPFLFKLTSDYPMNNLLLTAKKELDRAIAQYYINKENSQNNKEIEDEGNFKFDFNLKSRGYPTTNCLRFDGYDFISSFGSFFLYLPSAVNLLNY